MTEKADIYVLSGTEIKILLSGLGYERIVGLFWKENSNECQYSEIINVILNLIKQKIIHFDKEQMYIKDSLSKMLCFIGNAEYSFSIKFAMSSKIVSFYYSDDYIVACEPLGYQKDRYTIRAFSESQLYKELLSYDDMFEKVINRDYDITEGSLWSDNLNTIATIDIFKNCEHCAEINVSSCAFEAAVISVNYTEKIKEVITFSKENLCDVIRSIMSDR